MISSVSSTLPELPTQAIEFAQRLGSSSQELLEQPETKQLVFDGIQPNGRWHDMSATPWQDAILFEVYESAKTNPVILGEFLMYFMGTLLLAGKSKAFNLRRISEEDLAQSIVKDLLPNIVHLEFQSEAAFFSLLLKRLGWKANDHFRKENALRRQEGLQVDTPLESISLPSEQSDHFTKLFEKEARAQLEHKIGKLPQADRTLMGYHLAGHPIEECARLMGKTEAATRKQLQRILLKLGE